MKKQLLMVLFFIVFIPIVVNAEKCDNSSVFLSSVEVSSVNGNVEELSDSSINGKKLNLDLQFNNPGDYIEYNLVINNTSNDDYYLNDDEMEINENNIRYKFTYDDNSNVVKAGKTKSLKLKIEYKNRVSASQLVNNAFSDSNKVVLSMLNEKDITVPNT